MYRLPCIFFLTGAWPARQAVGRVRRYATLEDFLDVNRHGWFDVGTSWKMACQGYLVDSMLSLQGGIKQRDICD